MMHYGIPSYRLPRDVVESEIARIASMGVDIVCDHTVGDLALAMEDGDFDAAFLAVGAQRGKHAEIPAGDSARILDAVTLLHETEDDEPPLLGRRVVIYGGGDTAMDAARTARRLGADDAVVVYRRTRDRMPANEEEVRDAVAEGVQLKWLSTIAGARNDALTIERMELDADGFPQPTGRFEELAADSVVLALGQMADLSLLRGMPEIDVSDDVVGVGPGMMTARPGVFAGGDMVAGARTLTDAIGHGKKAARSIDAFLAGRRSAPPPDRHPLAGPEHLNTWYYADAPTRCGHAWTRRAGPPLSTRWSAGSTSPPPCSKHGVACRAVTASSATTASVYAPTTQS